MSYQETNLTTQFIIEAVRDFSSYPPIVAALLNLFETWQDPHQIQESDLYLTQLFLIQDVEYDPAFWKTQLAILAGIVSLIPLTDWRQSVAEARAIVDSDIPQ